MLRALFVVSFLKWIYDVALLHWRGHGTIPIGAVDFTLHTVQIQLVRQLSVLHRTAWISVVNSQFVSYNFSWCGQFSIKSVPVSRAFGRGY